LKAITNCKNFFKIILLIATPSVWVASCSTFLIPKDARNTPTNCFNMMWENIDEHYSFFDYKKINWNAIKAKYAPMVSDSISQDSLFSVLSAMLYELKDGHVNLTTATNRSRNWSWKEEFPDNFNPNFTQKQYLGRDFHATRALPNQILQDSIGYVHYSSFGSGISDGDLDYVLNRFKNTKGIIIDVRDNGGGSMNLVFKLMSRFVETKTKVGYTYVKNGKGHTDFEAPRPLMVEPAKKRTPYNKPVVILTNRGCYSATTHFAAFMSLLPNVTLVGDKTGGGGGIPISSDLPNGWQYRFSATYQTLPDGTQIEHGIAPDVEATTGAQNELEGKDAIIEKGIEVIKEAVKQQKKA
jgi:hypothetical protein